MDEEKKPAEEPAEDEKKPEGETPQESIDAKVARIEIATAALKAENDRADIHRQTEVLGGKADAGQVPKKPEEMSAKDYAAAAMRGEVPDART